MKYLINDRGTIMNSELPHHNVRTSDIARRYLDYFAKHDHLVVPSASLVSPNPTTLFTIAGMVPFIPYLMGEQTPPKRRMASQQKCVRTLDIDEVGKTTRHGTFFQMLGNFSFGDYFKEEAIHYAWEVLTLPLSEGGYGFKKDDLWVTVYIDDDEARSIWINEGVDPDHIQKLGMDENFWTTGGPGPGGPATEIYVDRGPAYGKEGGPSADENRYIEIWDLVFENYYVDNVKSKTDLHIAGELQTKNIDTGMGLERVAYLLQNKNNIYETDELFPVIEAAEKLSGKKYGEKEEDDVRFRIVSDHVRAALMIMSDGVRPSNVGRGYVLRRLLRRTIRSMKMLGVEQEVFPTLFPASENEMKRSYPEIQTVFADVAEAAYDEEGAFRRTLDKGTEIFDMAVRTIKEDSSHESSHKDSDEVLTISGQQAFQLHDTYGFPIELTTEMAREQGVQVDREEFTRLMKEQKQRAREDALKKRHNVDVHVYDDILQKLSDKQEFLGYSEFSARGTVKALIDDSGEVDSISAPALCEIVLDRTPFYTERGGQQADHGTLVSDDGAVVEVDDVQDPITGLTVHQCHLTEGTLRVGQEVVASIDRDRRQALARSHTATHILHQTLRDVLGPQATQRGSVVAPDFLHFDYQWGTALSKEVLHHIEDLVNQHIYQDLPVMPEYMDLQDALDSGALHLFGAKFGDRVRVVTIGEDGWSKEFCGGTHLTRTGQVGQFVITSDASIGSGVRRIDAYMGQKGYEYNAHQKEVLAQLSETLKTPVPEVKSKVDQLVKQSKEAERELSLIRFAQLESQIPQLCKEALESKDDVLGVSKVLGDVSDANQVRTLAAEIRSRLGEKKAVVVALGGILKQTGQSILIVATNQIARDKGIKAGDLVKMGSTILGGGGGGKPDIAQGGGKNIDRLGEAVTSVLSNVHKNIRQIVQEKKESIKNKINKGNER